MEIHRDREILNAVCHIGLPMSLKGDKTWVSYFYYPKGAAGHVSSSSTNIECDSETKLVLDDYKMVSRFHISLSAGGLTACNGTFLLL